ncbi:MAG: hypothetical protein JNM99_03410 [Verrucomicrobiaceae bacterium]|nr:hypothetical protein [Verrucomicrobiaceae bacterium]
MGARFLVKSFSSKIELLLGLVDVQHLKAELMAGSNVLCSLVAEQWDRAGNSDRLAVLASSIGDDWRDEFRNPVAMEFILALAAAVAILHPEKAKILLDRCQAECATKPEFKEALDEAREWQEAGELVSHASPEQKMFWHRQLAGRIGDWVWDTAEAKAAVSDLEQSRPGQGVSSRLLRDRVPGWAWNQRLERTQNLAGEAALRQRGGIQRSVWIGAGKWLLALIVGLTTGTLLNTDKAREALASINEDAATSSSVASTSERETPASEPDSSGSKSEAPEPSAPAESQEPKASTPTVAAADEKAPQDAPPAPAPGMPTTATIQPEADTPPAAVPLVAVKSDREGWVRTSLGEELELAKAKPVDGKILDSAGRPWVVPADLVLAKVEGMATGLSEAANLEKESAEPSAGSPPASPATAESQAASAPASPDSGGLDGGAEPQAKTEEVTVMKPVQSTPFNLHPDYFASSQQTASASSAPSSQPKTTSRKNASPSSSGPRPVVRSSSSKPKIRIDFDDSKSFVTRANNIRMIYRNGVWESSPGAYLAGAAGSPQEWARDMTLRERSSGTIPSNYMFQVLSNGAVQVVPDPQRGN